MRDWQIASSHTDRLYRIGAAGENSETSTRWPPPQHAAVRWHVSGRSRVVQREVGQVCLAHWAGTTDPWRPQRSPFRLGNNDLVARSAAARPVRLESLADEVAIANGWRSPHEWDSGSSRFQ